MQTARKKEVTTCIFEIKAFCVWESEFGDTEQIETFTLLQLFYVYILFYI